MHTATRLAALPLLTLMLGTSHPAQADGHGHAWMVGTWVLSLDSQAFGFSEDMPLRGLAVFNADGTFQIEDAGDFGQAGFTGIHLNQYGTWRPVRRHQVVGSALFLEADAVTHEVNDWQKTRLVLHRTHDPDVVEGHVTVMVLPCSMSPPTALNCPDPIEAADQFLPAGPGEIPISFHRVRAFD